MEQGPASTQGASNVVPLRVAGELPLPLEELVEQAFRIALGLVTISTEALARTVADTLGGSGPPAEPGGLGERAATPPLVAGAVIGATVGVARWAARATTTLVRTGELALSPITTSVVFQEGMRRLGSELDALDSRWRKERPREEAAAESFLRLLVPQVVDAALDQMDLNRVVAERVNVEEVVDRVDLDAVVARVDLDAVVARVDLDAVVERVDIDRILERVDLGAVVDRIPLDEVIARIDVDDIVAKVDLERVVDRIDVDAVAAKLDVEAVVRRLDLAAIAQEVVDELDLPEIIREAMGSMTGETVGGIRVQSMNADRAISGLVDRLLRRTRSDTETPD